MHNGKIKVIHMEINGEHYYFGSLKVMCQYFGRDKLGMSYNSLRANVRLTPDKPFHHPRNLPLKMFRLTISQGTPNLFNADFQQQKKIAQKRVSISRYSLVRKKGLEPSRCNHHKILSLARLPIPTLPHSVVLRCLSATTSI